MAYEGEILTTCGDLNIDCSRIAVGACVLFCLAQPAYSQTRSVNKKKEITVTKHASGTFDVKINPMPAEENVGDSLIGRLSLEKQFSGDMDGTSKGQMLGIGSAVKESGGYVAAERFVGTLDGKKGSFSLQHSGTMQGGKFDLNVSVVPESGTDELTGISGKMNILIEGGEHFYELDYSLPPEKWR
ncbi:MAG: DUF3224 domain-containing protein [Acidobacteriota bacterium]